MAETAEQYTSRILGHVEGQDALKIQRQTAPKLAKAIRGLTPSQLRSRPQPDKWSIAEIMAHLADAEIVVSWRMRAIIGANGTPIQAFNQDAWADAFQYGKRDPKQSLETFRMLRENNLAMLKAISKEAWENYGMHEERGRETIAHLTRLYAGHDENHVKQVENLAAQLKKKKRK